ncbi:enoyl-CoA hydratase/isomerase family protein [Tsukamurella sp. DT100]|uniref:enoyl-CoA hydratase/isomerase family protein n=1 Tax=Tsukamurella sp. DT100 TaxID=3393415 RepID=UPI003CF4BFD3
MTVQSWLNRVRLTIEDSVARITLIRGAGNGLDSDMATAFAAAAAAAVEDSSVRVVVLDAEGKAFCVGGDLRAFADSNDRGTLVAEIAGGMHCGILTLAGSSIPVVSVVHGTIAGGGIGVALCADIVLMASDAMLKSAYTAAGLSPDCGATWFLTARAGAAIALDLTLTNRSMSGADAARCGLVSRAVPAEQLAAEADAVIDALRHGSPAGLGRTKRLITGADVDALARRLDDEAKNIAAAIVEPDGAEGVAAFLEKRRPRFASSTL